MIAPRFYVDHRLGTSAAWKIGDPKETRVRVPDDLLKSVVFLCVKDQGRLRYCGTGFIVGWSELFPDRGYSYLVTARHVVDKASRYGNLHIRGNLRDGGSEVVEINAPTWYFPEDEESDVAVHPIFPPAELDAVSLGPNVHLTEAAARDYGLGIGDDIFAVGLFARHWGKTRNVPIVRSGIIAAMPGEPLEDPNSGREYHAYLAEMRSIGGLSGSPVFVYFGISRILEGAAQPYAQTKIFLLGLIRGHWAKEGVWLSDFGTDETETINTGIAIVTPIDDAIKIVKGDPELKKQRKEFDEKYAQSQAPVLDTAIKQEDAEFERFEDLTKELVRKPKNGGESKHEPAG